MKKKVLCWIAFLMISTLGVAEARWRIFGGGKAKAEKAVAEAPAARAKAAGEEVATAPFAGEVRCTADGLSVVCEAQSSLCDRRSWHPGGEFPWVWAPKLEVSYSAAGTYQIAFHCHAAGKVDRAGAVVEVEELPETPGPWRCKIGDDGNLYCEQEQ